MFFLWGQYCPQFDVRNCCQQIGGNQKLRKVKAIQRAVLEYDPLCLVGAYFGRLANHILTRGQIMPTTLLPPPPSPDYQTFLRPCLCTMVPRPLYEIEI